ncbi:hypothetical protein ACIP9X_14820 [Arthrobacter sp. NPDC093125]|uniref:hypothetical protein n=1 Tax=Arthrobacter sp. NPDC093125 TaxID=3363944 RepID=UPI00380F20DA
MWWRNRRRVKQEWAERIALLDALQQAPEPPEGYGPSWDAIVAGRREFAGKVLSGPWVNYDILVLVWGKPEHIPVRPEDFVYSADYFMTDERTAGPGEDETDTLPVTLEETIEWITDHPIQWYPPLKALARVGLVFGRDGTEASLKRPY